MISHTTYRQLVLRVPDSLKEGVRQRVRGGNCDGISFETEASAEEAPTASPAGAAAGGNAGPSTK